MAAVKAEVLFEALAALRAVHSLPVGTISPDLWKQCMYAGHKLYAQLELAGLRVEVTEQEPA